MGAPAGLATAEAARNTRNGSTPKTVVTDGGPVDIAVPRDRAGSFATVFGPKHERRFTGLAGAPPPAKTWNVIMHHFAILDGVRFTGGVPRPSDAEFPTLPHTRGREPAGPCRELVAAIDEPA